MSPAPPSPEGFKDIFRRDLTWRGGFGQYKEETRIFKTGDTYTFQIEWKGTDNGQGSGTIGGDGADWDYHMVVEPQGQDTGGILIDSYDPENTTIDTETKLLDPQDLTDEDDNDDNIENFPTIPATTFAAGSNPIPSFESSDPNIEGHNYDMPSDIPNGWPVARTNDPQVAKKGWLHGDFKNVAFLYTYRAYEKMSVKANLNQPTSNP